MAQVRENMASTTGRNERLFIFTKYEEIVPFEIRKSFFNVVFFMFSLYFIFYMMISMWPILVGLVVMYFHNTGHPFNALIMMDVIIRLSLFVFDLIFNMMVRIMKFVMNF